MKIYPKSRRYKQRTRLYGFNRRSSVFESKSGHKIKVGSKPGSILSEKDIERELSRIPESEIRKIKRVNMADYSDFLGKIYQSNIKPNESGLVHEKRGRDVYLINQMKKDMKDVLQHEIGHSLTNKEYKEEVLPYIEDINKSLFVDKKKRIGILKEDISESFAKKKQKEVFGNG